MGTCPECECEFEDPIEVCPHCNVPLVTREEQVSQNDEEDDVDGDLPAEGLVVIETTEDDERVGELRELLEESYVNGLGVENPQIPTDRELPHILEKVSPIHEVVKVDLFLPGCPPPADAFWQILNDIVAGRQPHLPYDIMHFDS